MEEIYQQYLKLSAGQRKLLCLLAYTGRPTTDTLLSLYAKGENLDRNMVRAMLLKLTPYFKSGFFSYYNDYELLFRHRGSSASRSTCPPTCRPFPACTCCATSWPPGRRHARRHQPKPQAQQRGAAPDAWRIRPAQGRKKPRPPEKIIRRRGSSAGVSAVSVLSRSKCHLTLFSRNKTS